MANNRALLLLGFAIILAFILLVAVVNCNPAPEQEFKYDDDGDIIMEDAFEEPYSSDSGKQSLDLNASSAEPELNLRL